MRKVVLTLLLVVLVPSILPAGFTAQAASERLYPPCAELQSPGGVDPCRPAFNNAQTLRLKDNVPFVWLRAYPQSPVILTTVYPGGSASLEVYGDPNYQVSMFDGYQWWWLVSTYPNPTTLGWVEQASLIESWIPSTPTDPTQMANWTTPMNGQVVPGVPFLWIRSTPSSVGQVVSTIPANGYLLILGAPQFDGVQWWWFVQDRFGAGYVEQSRIMPR